MTASLMSLSVWYLVSSCVAQSIIHVLSTEMSTASPDSRLVSLDFNDRTLDATSCTEDQAWSRNVTVIITSDDPEVLSLH